MGTLKRLDLLVVSTALNPIHPIHPINTTDSTDSATRLDLPVSPDDRRSVELDSDAPKMAGSSSPRPGRAGHALLLLLESIVVAVEVLLQKLWMLRGTNYRGLQIECPSFTVDLMTFQMSINKSGSRNYQVFYLI